jgi:transposase
MAHELVDDELWQVVEPLLPKHKAMPGKPGRPPVSDRAAMAGILFVLKSGIPWEMLPQEMGCGSGMTCWRRLRDWHEAGVWQKLHAMFLSRLEKADKIDWSRASVDSISVRAKGAKKGGLQVPRSVPRLSTEGVQGRSAIRS